MHREPIGPTRPGHNARPTRRPAVQARWGAWGAALALTLVSAPAAAALVTYTFSGSFAGSSSGDSVLRTAIDPVLGTQGFSVTVTLDTAAAGSPAPGGGTLYRAVTASSARFAGFTSVDQPCAAATSDFICTAKAVDGTGVIGGTGSDRYDLLTTIASAPAFDLASGQPRALSFQFQFFVNDFTGHALGNESVDLDFSALDLSTVAGDLAVFARTDSSLTSGFDRADYTLQLTSIELGGGPSAVPEPGVLALATLAGLALRLAGRRRSAGR